MKRILVIYLTVLLRFLNASGQEFSFKMIFIDAIGNTDTLIMGYDIDATDSVDAEFGEVNIIDNELDSLFDVRITNEWKVRAWIGYQYKSKYHLKKQIVKTRCGQWADPMSVDIKCSHWPVMAKWDNNLFVGDLCREGSVFTSLHPGLWWDVMTPSDLFYRKLADFNEVTFTSNADDYFYPGNIGENSYINPDQDTIPVFWVVIGSKAIWNHIEQESYNDNLVLYPNPSHDLLRISSRNQVKIRNVEVYDLTGNKLDVPVFGNEINSSGLIDGVYFVKITINENKIVVKKFIKF